MGKSFGLFWACTKSARNCPAAQILCFSIPTVHIFLPFELLSSCFFPACQKRELVQRPLCLPRLFVSKASRRFDCFLSVNEADMGEEGQIVAAPASVEVPKGEVEAETAEEKAVHDLEVKTEGTVPFKEESYYVKDLKEAERKALEELKAKIEEAIEGNSFLVAVEASKEVQVEKKEVEVEKKEEEGAGEKPKELDPVLEEEAGTEETVEGEAVVSTQEPNPVGDTVIQEEIAKELVEEKEEASLPIQPVADEVPAEASDKPAPELVEMENTNLDDSPPLDDLALWGVPILHSKGDERTDVILLKFLRAREFKVNDALSMLKDTLIWRKDFMADSLIDEETLNEFDSVAYMHGLDKEGHPVCYNHYGVFQDKELYQKTFEDEAQFKNFLRWRIQVLEKGIQKLDFSPSGVHSMVQITDFKDSPGFVKWMNIMRKPLNLLQDNYPELVAKQIFINVPWYFGALYPVFGKRLTPRSKSKVVVARTGKVTETLFKYISPEYVPVHYGGLSRANDTEFEGVEAPVKEVIVKASDKQTIELPVEESGSTVVWDVGVVGWEVMYGEEFVPSGERSYTVIIQKSRKVGSSEEPLRNSFKATEPGKVVLTIDNTTSRRKKVVVYRFRIKKAAAPPIVPTIDA